MQCCGCFFFSSNLVLHDDEGGLWCWGGAVELEHLTSWFAHAMRCSCGTSNSFAFLDSTAVWRGGLMHVVCLCGTTGVLHLWT